MDAKIAFVFLMMTTVAVKGFAKVEKESVEGEVAGENKFAEEVAAENEKVEGDVAKKIKEIAHVLEDTRREVKMLKAHNHVDKRGGKLGRIVRSETRRALQEMEDKLEGKAETIEATGRQDGMTSHLRQNKEVGLPTFLDKLIEFVNGELYHSILYLNKTVKAHRDAILERSNQEKLLKKADDSIKTEISDLKSEVNAVKSTVANRLRCHSGYEEICLGEETSVANFGRLCSAPGKWTQKTKRVQFNPAFSGTPISSFGLTLSLGEEERSLSVKSVTPTYIEFNISGKSTWIYWSWIACGNSNGHMEAEMLLEFLRSNK